MVDCSLTLEDFGGDTQKGREAYWNQLLADLDEELDVKSGIFGQSIIGGESFLCWVKETFFSKGETRELPALGKIKGYRQKETILALIKAET